MAYSSGNTDKSICQTNMHMVEPDYDDEYGMEDFDNKDYIISGEQGKYGIWKIASFLNLRLMLIFLMYS